MKKYYYLLPGLLIIILVSFLAYLKKNPQNKNSNQENFQEETTASAANPASKYCEENGGELEIVTAGNGSQFGMCKFEDYSCEEWAYYRGECDIVGDAEKIRVALVAKGLDLSDMKVVINKHLGKFIGGSVVPVSTLGGGGYVFAVKEDDKIKVLADGNGAIMCSAFENYPDFPAYLVPECIDEAGNQVIRGI